MIFGIRQYMVPVVLLWLIPTNSDKKREYVRIRKCIGSTGR